MAGNEGRGSDRKRSTLLYVEDEEENYRVANLRMRRFYNLEWARTAEEACYMMRERGDSYAAILMDIQLAGSGMDGIELTRFLRGKLPTSKAPAFTAGVKTPLTIPILFVTAYGGRYSEQELIDAGGDRRIEKPVNFVALNLALTETWLARTKS